MFYRAEPAAVSIVAAVMPVRWVSLSGKEVGVVVVVLVDLDESALFVPHAQVQVLAGPPVGSANRGAVGNELVAVKAKLKESESGAPR